jgi:hypothetical protein
MITNESSKPRVLKWLLVKVWYVRTYMWNWCPCVCACFVPIVKEYTDIYILACQLQLGKNIKSFTRELWNLERWVQMLNPSEATHFLSLEILRLKASCCCCCCCCNDNLFFFKIGLEEDHLGGRGLSFQARLEPGGNKRSNFSHDKTWWTDLSVLPPRRRKFLAVRGCARKSVKGAATIPLKINVAMHPGKLYTRRLPERLIQPKNSQGADGAPIKTW